MDCSIFRKKLQDLIEDNLSYDLREAMLEHIKNCKECSSIYYEELEIDEMFRIGLSADSQDFRSLRSDIMKNIDKSRYGASPLKKLLKHFKSYMATYTSLAAIVAVFVFLVPYVKEHGLIGAAKSSTMSRPQTAGKGGAATSTAQNEQVDKRKALTTLDNTTADTYDKSIAEDNNEANEKRDIDYLPKFEKKILDKNVTVTFNTPWEYSLNKKYSATVEGKGEQAQEEGIGNIILKDLSNGHMWIFSLTDNEKKQFSPKVVKWIDDENLLVVIGLGQGHLHQGGELYILNINSVHLAKADPENTVKIDSKSEITKILSISKENAEALNIEVEVMVFEDSRLNVNHRENRRITSPFNEIIKQLQP